MSDSMSTVSTSPFVLRMVTVGVGATRIVSVGESPGRKRPEYGRYPDRSTSTVKAPKPIVEKVTTLLLREKLLVKLDTLVFHVDALQKLKEDVAALKGSAPGGRATVDVAAFKDRFGVSRKFAIPLLEYLDRERVTRRTGDVRLVL